MRTGRLTIKRTTNKNKNMKITARRYGLNYCELKVEVGGGKYEESVNADEMDEIVDAAFEAYDCLREDLGERIIRLMKARFYPSVAKEICEKLLNELNQ